MKLLTYEKVLNKKAKQAFVGFYFQAFDSIYEIRNKLIHQGVSFKKYDVNLDLSIFEACLVFTV